MKIKNMKKQIVPMLQKFRVIMPEDMKKTQIENFFHCRNQK